MKDILRVFDAIGDVIGTLILSSLIFIGRIIITPIEFLATLVAPKDFDEKK